MVGATAAQWQWACMAKLARLDAKAFDRAVAAYRAGSHPVAEALLARLVAQEPAHAGAHFLLGLLALERGNNHAAERWLEKACELQPQNAGLFSNFAEAARRLGKLEVALARFEVALALDDSQLESHFNFGLALAASERLVEARESFRRALALAPNDAKLARRLARAHHELGELDDAEDVLERSLARAPDDARALAALGAVLFHSGRHGEAEAKLRRSLQLQPSAQTHGALLFQSMFSSAHDAASIREEARAFGRAYGGPHLRLPAAARERARDPERRLRIGYLSADFREHVTANVVLPLLRHQSSAVEVHCYASQRERDSFTEEFRRLSMGWRDIRDLDDQRAAELIAADGIDILVDLTMHMAGSRWGVVARKPAPLQLCWFAYPGSSGLASVDYRVSDSFLDPPGSDDAYPERTLRLPDCFWCWEPLLEELESGDPPCAKRGYVTFGCLNNFCKVTDETLVAWSRVLGGVPGSRLLLLAPPGRARGRVLERLSNLGVSEERVRFVPHQNRRAYFELYREIDVCLDTLPYNGHTTSLDAFWMGVPVVTLVGERCVGRAGLCQAHALDLPELVAHSLDELVGRYLELLAAPERLREYRRSLRLRLQASPLMNGARFAASFEQLYRDIWRDWCQTEPAP